MQAGRLHHNFANERRRKIAVGDFARFDGTNSRRF